MSFISSQKCSEKVEFPDKLHSGECISDYSLEITWRVKNYVC